MRFEVDLGEEQLEAIARRAAELVLERLQEARSPASEWLSIDEAAEVLRCKPQRIYDLRSGGRLSQYSEGGRALVSRVEVEALVVADRVALALPSASGLRSASGVVR